MTTADYLTQLQQDRENLVDNLEAKGITGLTGDETFTELVPQVANVKYKPQCIFFSYIPSGSANTEITNLDYEVANVDTSLVTSMQKMFQKMAGIKKLDLSGWNTSNVIDMSYMFNACGKLQKIDASNFTAKQNVNINWCYAYCSSLNLLDMRNFDFTLVGNKQATFSNGFPATCEIVVADSTQKEWFATNFSLLTNVMTATEYDAKCHIHLEYGDGSSISKKYYYSIDSGDTTTLPDSTDITPPTGKVFDHWEDSEGNTVTSYIATSSDINKTIEFTAIYVDE